MRIVKWNITTVIFLASAGNVLTACNGGGNNNSPPISAPPVVVTPSPTPSPSPTPTPTPTPADAKFLGASPGQALVGLMSCARDEATFDRQGRLTGIAQLTGAKIDNALAVTYRGTDSYTLDINGFGGPVFSPTDKVVSSNRVYSQFLNPTQGEFFIFKDEGGFGSRTFTTIGLDNSSSLCFFALGRPADGLPVEPFDEHGLTIDGAGRIGDQILRLFGSNGKMLVNPETRAVTVELRLTGRADPFGDFTAMPTQVITSADFTVQYDATGSFSSSFSATNGYSGTINGFFTTPSSDAVGGSGAGAAITFELRNARGEVLFGAIASEANRI